MTFCFMFKATHLEPLLLQYGEARKIIRFLDFIKWKTLCLVLKNMRVLKAQFFYSIRKPMHRNNSTAEISKQNKLRF